ncbi:type VI secretion system membrane subunit TssM [Alloalcanivorax xenomutans]|uniref:type VI secretion system membrane subunit TssM n=1 Tax=Alloalcanivorax xenomutans TaxID=1094342 RepID=UPI00292CF311|nr:type VI secretion system membrane subunit TssM [Alloalcanivorax xenomutans]WOA33529.1 type VI secretion system membrane subunit TssM [Alloalcanivorax xenomutans]
MSGMRKGLASLGAWLINYRLWAVVALVIGIFLLWRGGDPGSQIGFALLILALALGLFALISWGIRRWRERRATRDIDGLMNEQAERATRNAKAEDRGDIEEVRGRMQEAVKAIKSSRLGVLKGKAALYELPWHVIIGNPAAGKSSAILNSGLKFPFEDNRNSVVQGIGGTRNCDWYFTAEGIVLDTAGRYSVGGEDRGEWLSFLDLLKKHRPRAPINGIIIAASIAELSGNRPEFAIELARNLRQRVQEVTERLEVFAPVYVVFTKADLIAGFMSFFSGLDPSEREKVWGATLPYDPQAQVDELSIFDQHFDELAEGLKEMGLSHMAMQRGREVAPGLLTLPLEFVSLKPVLRTFIASLFEDNPYQFKPVFRGFYFTSALHEGETVLHASERIADEFSLAPRQDKDEPVNGNPDQAHFLKDLFRKVIFADKELVRQYSSPYRTRMRYGAFLAGALVVAALLGTWAWSYTTNRQLVANASRDLQQAVQIQEGRLDLQSRIDALLLLQDRLEQLRQYRRDGGITTTMGLYQGDNIEAALWREYFAGMDQVMVRPTRARLEEYLGKVVANADQLSMEESREEPRTALYVPPSPKDPAEAYNALKAYLMLGDHGRVEQTHLANQLTRYWRGWLDVNRGQMSHEEVARAAEKLMTFYVASAGKPGWPEIDTRVSLVNDTRQALRGVMQGQPAMERVFAQIKARAAARFATITVNSLLAGASGQNLLNGSYAISGAFSREAWQDYIKDAIHEAANTQLNTTDWVLDTTEQSDLSLAGSPEHIARQLTALYKQEYAAEWQRFLRGVSVAGFSSGFDDATSAMNRLGNSENSPLRALLRAVHEQTVWDNPRALYARVSERSEQNSGIVNWFKRVILRRAPAGMSGMSFEIDEKTGEAMLPPLGPVGKAFEGFAQLMEKQSGQPPAIDAYFEALAATRSRLNDIKMAEVPGPGARALMQETLSNQGSELSSALRLVDEQLLTGLGAEEKQALRPLLLQPLTQTFAALVPAAENEINRTWQAQVYQPFDQGIGQQFPFDLSADEDAPKTEVAAIFGPSGAIAAFNKDALGSLVIQRGNVLTPRRWAGMGIRLSPELVSGYGDWVSGQSGGAGEADVTIFQILPAPAIGAVEYVLEIDGQSLRYRNTPPQWETMQWPNRGATPGARLVATTSDGRQVQLADFPGENGFAQLMDAASLESRPDSSTVTWSKGTVSISMEMRTVRRAGSGSDSDSWQRGLKLPRIVAGEGAGEQLVSQGGENE